MRSIAILCSVMLFLCTASAQNATRPAYLDPSKPVQVRVADLISRMTLEEKAQQLNHLNSGIPRLGVKAWGGWNQTLHGVWSKQPTTLFPAPIAMGATWDTPLIQTITGAMVRPVTRDTSKISIAAPDGTAHDDNPLQLTEGRGVFVDQGPALL